MQTLRNQVNYVINRNNFVQHTLYEVIRYKQTILGPLWLIINPLFSTMMYTFVFGNLAKIGTDGIPFLLFYYSGSMLWTFFAGCFNDASNIFINNSNLFGKVYFPRFTVPISNVFSNMTKILVQFIMLMLFYIYYLITSNSLTPALELILFPILFIWLSRNNFVQHTLYEVIRVTAT